MGRKEEESSENMGWGTFYAADIPEKGQPAY